MDFGVQGETELSDKPEIKEEEPTPHDSPELWQLIDWIFYAGSQGEPESEEQGDDEDGEE
jgi:hypothetical protein